MGVYSLCQFQPRRYNSVVIINLNIVADNVLTSVLCTLIIPLEDTLHIYGKSKYRTCIIALKRYVIIHWNQSLHWFTMANKLVNNTNLISSSSTLFLNLALYIYQHCTIIFTFLYLINSIEFLDHNCDYEFDFSSSSKIIKHVRLTSIRIIPQQVRALNLS